MSTVHLRAEATIVTSFQDADPMGVIYHGNYFRFFEEARRLLMEKIDYGYRDMEASGFLWPVIDANVRYIKAIEYNQTIRIIATLAEWENRLKVDYLITDPQSGKRLCKGHTVQVPVRLDNKELQFEAPKVLEDKLLAYSALSAELGALFHD
ncbi:4-hydroxybenzoyl-CoA thioesterase [Enterovibrio norvegicus FF-162]|uniref:acyl-CoA thioesterase n=1 Tax=Enterovibrio norvegicus TaxID=188144 RepID=UPI000365F709|nr:acyl-CoA thioesterase [Enterovibrio norvegicus]OEE88811.1 4-hydroxybenzoyl-CoA thioesterase [Enterovibrio norvegicus FF-162]